MAVTDVELTNVKEERDQARGDLVDTTDRDELLTKAQKERDNATERRTKAEVELAKTRVELMQANSQLLESIQQKVELSQQLEQWQVSKKQVFLQFQRIYKIIKVMLKCLRFHLKTFCFVFISGHFSKYFFFFLFQMDMQELIEEQMRSKMINNRKVQTAEPQQSSAATNLAKRWSNYKLWSLFQR